MVIIIASCYARDRLVTYNTPIPILNFSMFQRVALKKLVIGVGVFES